MQMLAWLLALLIALSGGVSSRRYENPSATTAGESMAKKVRIVTRSFGPLWMKGQEPKQRTPGVIDDPKRYAKRHPGAKVITKPGGRIIVKRDGRVVKRSTRP